MGGREGAVIARSLGLRPDHGLGLPALVVTLLWRCKQRRLQAPALTRARERLGVRAAILGATPLSQAGGLDKAGEHASPRESGAVEAGLRLASLSPHSTTLSRSLAPYSLVMAAAS